MPTQHGESAVIRLLRKGSGIVGLNQIRLLPRDEGILHSALQLPFGMIIVTGPARQRRLPALLSITELAL